MKRPVAVNAAGARGVVPAPATTSWSALASPEIGNLHDELVAACLEEQVGWLDVAVHDPARVRCTEAVAGLNEQRDGDSWFDRAHPIEQNRHVLSVEERHDEEGHARVVVDPVVDDRNDVRVHQRPGQPGLAEESCAPFFSVDRPCGHRESLQGDERARSVTGFVDGAHRTAAKYPLQRIPPGDPRAGRQAAVLALHTFQDT